MQRKKRIECKIGFCAFIETLHQQVRKHGFINQLEVQIFRRPQKEKE